MKLFPHAFVLGAIFLGCAIPARATICAPAKLVHIAVENVTPGIDAASFAAQPKNYYRIGSDKLRIEEAVDTVNGIHALIVVSEPNIWMINLYDNTGRHIVDPGPTFYAKAPVFGTELSGKLIGLEFGCEADFIAANSPKPTRLEQIGSEKFEVYRIDDGPDAVEILERSGTTTPAFARYYHQGKLTMALRYDLYSTNLSGDPNLFSPPPTVRYVEASSQPSPIAGLSPEWIAVTSQSASEYAHYVRKEADGTVAQLTAYSRVCDCDPLREATQVAARFEQIPGVAVSEATVTACGQQAQRILVTGLASVANAERNNVEVLLFREEPALVEMIYAFKLARPLADDEAALLDLCPKPRRTPEIGPHNATARGLL